MIIIELRGKSKKSKLGIINSSLLFHCSSRTRRKNMQSRGNNIRFMKVSNEYNCNRVHKKLPPPLMVDSQVQFGHINMLL